MSAGFQEFHRPIDGRSTVQNLSEFLSGLQAGRISTDPEYQRDVVWTEDKQESFMGFLLEGGPSPSIFLREVFNREDGVEYEVVDGKQRLTTIRRWFAGEIGARLMDGRIVQHSEFDTTELRLLRLRVSFPTVIIQGDDKYVMSVYLRINGGTPHTPEELARVRALIG